MLDYGRIKRDLLTWLRPEEPTDRERRLGNELGHGKYEIYTHKLDAALDEARTVFTRTGESSMLKSGDLIVGVHNAKGDLVTASCGTYIHAPITQLPVKFVRERYINSDSNMEINPGDIFYANEALIGSLHNPDQIAIMPIFHDDELIAWASAAHHQAETGAIEQGGQPQSAETRYDEGMRLTPIKIAEDYEIRDDLMDMMVNFISRAPRLQEIDVRARCTAVNKLSQRIEEIADETSADFVHGLFYRMIDSAKEGARNRVASWNDGTYRSVAFFDSVGHDETLMKIGLSIHKEGDQIHFDFSDVSPEQGSYNTFVHGIASFLATYLYPYVFHDLPVSTGAFDPFTFEAPEGSVLNANPEKSVCNCVFTGRTVVGLCHDVFTRMIYASDTDRAAASPSTNAGTGSFQGINQHGVSETDMFTFTMNTDGAGARPDKDGIDAHGFMYGPWGKAPNTEDSEVGRMFLGLERGYLQDTAGFGKRRGGSGTQNVNVVVSDHPVMIDSRGIGSRIPQNIGIFGGYNTTSLPGLAIRDTDILERLESGDDLSTNIRDIVANREIDGEYQFDRINRSTLELSKGDVIVHLCGGGGGWGDPVDRDPEEVVSDLEKGVISETVAENVYRVAVEDGELDAEQTAKLREKEREDRVARGRSFEEFTEEWEEKRPSDEILKHYGEWPEGMNRSDAERENEVQLTH